ncbi:MAG: phosphate/phosphite/phosphonate ABC transporter substrate-binding protein [Phycisphaeraceae bacterium]|nr:phosphate/phosphite/phosphonate ABC transporter substrate-binding protein [Phycisphaeraceae bacterium]
MLRQLGGHDMLKYIIFAVSIALTMGASVSTGAAVSEPVELTFGVYSSDKATVMYKMFIPIVRHLQESTEAKLKQPVDIYIKIFRTYDEGIDALVQGQVDLVRFGPASYILAKAKNPNITLVAMESKKGKKRFQGMIFVSKNSPIKSLKDVKGKRFAFGDHNSTIGRYLAQAELVKAGIYEDDLEECEYLGRHDKVVKAVLLKDYEVGSAKESTFNKYNEKDELRVIQRFDNVTKPWIAREGLNPAIRTAIKETLLSLTDEEILREAKISQFVEAEDVDYRIIRDGMRIAQAFSSPQEVGMDSQKKRR